MLHNVRNLFRRDHPVAVAIENMLKGENEDVSTRTVVTVAWVVRAAGAKTILSVGNLKCACSIHETQRDLVAGISQQHCSLRSLYAIAT